MRRFYVRRWTCAPSGDRQPEGRDASLDLRGQLELRCVREPAPPRAGA